MKPGDGRGSLMETTELFWDKEAPESEHAKLPVQARFSDGTEVAFA